MDRLKFPHIKYLSYPIESMLLNTSVKSDTFEIKKRYKGVSFNLTNNEIYTFKHKSYSPSSDVKYKKVLVTHDDNGNNIGMETEPDKWEDV